MSAEARYLVRLFKGYDGRQDDKGVDREGGRSLAKARRVAQFMVDNRDQILLGRNRTVTILSLEDGTLVERYWTEELA